MSVILFKTITLRIFSDAKNFIGSVSLSSICPPIKPSILTFSEIRDYSSHDTIVGIFFLLIHSTRLFEDLVLILCRECLHSLHYFHLYLISRGFLQRIFLFFRKRQKFFRYEPVRLIIQREGPFLKVRIKV